MEERGHRTLAVLTAVYNAVLSNNLCWRGRGSRNGPWLLLHHLTTALLRESYYALKRNVAPGARYSRSGASVC